MKEMKEINDMINIDKPYRLSLLESNIPPKYKATVMQKLNVLRTMEPGDPEYYKIKHWVDMFMRVPFGNYKNLDVKMSEGIEVCSRFIVDAKTTLDNCVYGLDDAKLQILQMVGQWIANPKAMGTAIAINGPPGTGKTTLIKDGISKILGREFAFVTLGGSSDSSTLKGHSYTYEGSTHGKIADILIQTGKNNPIIFFDELDKVSTKTEEIYSVLTHLTDTTQNNEFHDNYFSEIELDVSKCLFVFSYNDESKVS
jgi:ATP-dependent Lon protease